MWYYRDCSSICHAWRQATWSILHGIVSQQVHCADDLGWHHGPRRSQAEAHRRENPRILFLSPVDAGQIKCFDSTWSYACSLSSRHPQHPGHLAPLARCISGIPPLSSLSVYLLLLEPRRFAFSCFLCPCLWP